MAFATRGLRDQASRHVQGQAVAARQEQGDVMRMTKDEFHNALRILHSIDSYELGNAEIDVAENWTAFIADPCEWFIRASDKNATLLWTIIERRMNR
jgi:aminoglycoside phosphotransferase (APT) family kinase protein